MRGKNWKEDRACPATSKDLINSTIAKNVHMSPAYAIYLYWEYRIQGGPQEFQDASDYTFNCSMCTLQYSWSILERHDIVLAS